MDDLNRLILNLLKKNGDMFISEIASKLKKSPATISKYLAVLEGKGLVESYVRGTSKYFKIKE